MILNNVPSGFTGLEFFLDFIISDERCVARMGNCQQVPVAQQTTPRLKQPAVNTINNKHPEDAFLIFYRFT